MPTLEQQAETRSVAFYALGCRANQLEASALADEFRSHGWQITSFSEKASLYIINTCTVTADGDKESRRIIRQAKRRNPDAQVAVTGCYVQVAPGQVAAIEGVNYVIGNNFKQDIYRIVQEAQPEDGPLVRVSEMDKSRIMVGASTANVHRTRASLKIQDGCDFKCTYCIIWVARGPSRSLPGAFLKQQFADLVAQGQHEIVLTGINIGQYQDPENGADLAALLRELVTVPGTYRIRLSSLDPAEVTPDLLDVMADFPEKICPYLHLSLQSAQDDVLKLMARRHRVADLDALCERILAKLPDAAIGADVIAGFPGETAERFAATYGVLDRLPLSYFHTFTYSPREGTPAADFPDQVPIGERQERTRQLIALSDAKNLTYRQKHLGERLHVLVEESGTQGLTENYISVTLDANHPLPQNTLAPVAIRTVTPETTLGEILPA